MAEQFRFERSAGTFTASTPERLCVRPSAILCSLLLAGGTYAGGRNSRDPGILACGDQNGDKVIDLLVASRDEMVPEVAWLLSGKDGKVLHVFSGDPDALGFGDQIACPGDLDGDGKPDFALSTSGSRQVPIPHGSHIVRRGRARCQLISSKDFTPILEFPTPARMCVIRGDSSGVDPKLGFLDAEGISAIDLTFRSLKDGSEIRKLSSPQGWVFMNDIATVGDIDGDHIEDVCVPIRQLQPASKGEGPMGVIMLSGKDGAELWRHVEVSGRMSDSATIACPGDLDHDGTSDLLLGAESRWVMALSGKKGKPLYQVPALHDKDHIDNFGTSLDGIADMDGDGIVDWIVGANGEAEAPFSGDGYVWISSGKDGKRIREVISDGSHGYDVCVLSDIDGDGTVDLGLLVESTKGRWTDSFDPEVRVVSSKDGHVIWKTTTRALRAMREDLAPRLLPPAEPLVPEKPR